MSEQQPRPGHTTLAGGVIIGSSVILILSAWQRISTLHTLEAREGFEEVLSQPIWEASGLTVDGMATAIRVLCLVGAGAAVAATILGFQVFKRSASARVVLTALSPLLLFGGMATDGFLAPLAVAGVAMLWLQPTRDWYAGRPWVQAYEKRRADRAAAMRSARGEAPSAPSHQSPPSSPSPPVPPAEPLAPRPVQQWGEPVRQQPAPVPPADRGRAVRGPRPAALKAACAITWVASGFVAIGIVLSAVLVPSQGDELFEEAARQQPRMVEDYDLTRNDLIAGVYLLLAMCLVWVVIAVVLAVLAWLGHDWARITLVVSAACAGGLTLLISIGAWPLVTLVLAMAVSLWLLMRPEVARWYKR